MGSSISVAPNPSTHSGHGHTARDAITGWMWGCGDPEIGLLKNLSLLYGVSQFNVSLIQLTVRGKLAYRSNKRFTLAGNPEGLDSLTLD